MGAGEAGPSSSSQTLTSCVPPWQSRPALSPLTSELITGCSLAPWPPPRGPTLEHSCVGIGVPGLGCTFVHHTKLAEAAPVWPQRTSWASPDAPAPPAALDPAMAAPASASSLAPSLLLSGLPLLLRVLGLLFSPCMLAPQPSPPAGRAPESICPGFQQVISSPAAPLTSAPLAPACLPGLWTAPT